MISKVKAQVVQVISRGANVCACCGEHRLVFLSVDHIDGSGGTARKQVPGLNDPKSHQARSGAPYYRWLIRNNYPGLENLQILCHNCNRAKHDLGECPHVTERAERARMFEHLPEGSY